MNFLRRRLSDSSFVANLPNGYMMDLQRPDNSTSNPVSPATERRQQPIQQPTALSSGTSIFNSISSAMKQTTQAAAGLIEQSATPVPVAQQKPQILLIIDDPHTDWAKYFQGKKVNGEFEIRVEQAEFSELNLAAYSTAGCMVDMQVIRNGTKVVRSFKPDFVLIRQHAYSMALGEDFRSLIIGLQYGGVHSVNSLFSIYNFCSKPWVFSQLIKIVSSLGYEKFPLVEQTFFPSHKQMVKIGRSWNYVEIDSTFSDLTFKDRRFPEIISVSSMEGTYPASLLGPNAIESYSSDLDISTSSVEEISTSKLSKENIAHEVKYNERHIEDICICCGGFEIHTQHPLFHGGMCAPCTERFLERFFLCDDDGYQADCTICCWGKSLIMCDHSACHKCFCEECVDTLVYPGCSEEIKETTTWICFMCAPQHVNGLLKRRIKWRAVLKHFYDQESNSPNIWIYQLLSPRERKSIHVLSLFDNITEELKSLGFLEGRRDNGYLKYMDDVTDVIRTNIEEWGPFDFIFGSTPPVAKFYKHPSAWYFYQYFRILQYGSPEEKNEKPFFWLFVDNIVLDEEERDAASRFFQMEAVLRYKQDDSNVQNAVHIWSNIPSVNSKYSASALNMDLSLLADNICRSRTFSQRPATLIREFFVPLKDYFRAFS